MKTLTLLLSATSLMCCIACAVPARAQVSRAGHCMEKSSAADVVSNARGWDDIYQSFGMNKGCDDGELAEAYSDVVTRLLVRWKDMQKLAALIAKDPAFDEFLFRHIDSLMTKEQAEQIIFNSKNSCQNGLSNLCDRIRLSVEQ